MRIKKILNNNVVETFENGKEVIVVGSGLAFNKKVGDLIDKQYIQKYFILKDNDFSINIKMLLSKESPELIEAITQIVLEASKFLNTKLSDAIYLSLADHIVFAILRKEKNIAFSTPLAWNVRSFFSAEHEMGMRSLEIIDEHTGIELPNTEASFLALHFVNATQNNSENMNEVYRITKIINDTVEIIKSSYDKELDEDSVDYGRLITHLNFFAKRILFDEKREITQDIMLQQLQATFIEENHVIEKIADYIKKEYDVVITESEKVYLIIHLSRIFSNKHL